jgi:hypothetical protein
VCDESDAMEGSHPHTTHKASNTHTPTHTHTHTPGGVSVLLVVLSLSMFCSYKSPRSPPPPAIGMREGVGLRFKHVGA